MNTSVETLGHDVSTTIIGGYVEHNVGYLLFKVPSFGARTDNTAKRGIKRRTRPAGLFLWPAMSSSARPTSVRAGFSRATSCSPASVNATLLVVRASRRTPNSSSSVRIAWLMAEGETPRRFAAFVKLRSSATARKVASEVRSLGSIHEFYSQLHARFPCLRRRGSAL
jgi:hypothetical protein